jgi:hypothetical protein
MHGTLVMFFLKNKLHYFGGFSARGDEARAWSFARYTGFYYQVGDNATYISNF